MNGEESFLQIALHASLVVKLVLLLLIGASIASWAMIFRKRKLLRDARNKSEEFEKRFWSGGDLAGMYKEISGTGAESGMEHIFEAGFAEFARLRKQSDAPVQIVEGARRAMRVAQIREVDRLEENLVFLATVGSISPYVGLFGTVWGIMTSFQSIAASKNTSLAVVAPGIAEALFATALGLVAAIPATIFYNKFASEVNKQAQRLEGFADEFAAILSRQMDERG